MKTKNYEFITAISMIIGAVIGAGIFGLPYAFVKVGFFAGLGILILSIVIIIILMLSIVELTLAVKKEHQVPGLIGHFLGDTGRKLNLTAFAIGVYGATTAYLTGCSGILSEIFGVEKSIVMLFYFAFIFFLVLKGIRTIAFMQFFSVISISFIAVLLFISHANMINFSNFSLDVNINEFIPSFGVILFACLGMNIIPEMARHVSERKGDMITIVITAMTICFAVYAVFSFVFAGTYGTSIKDVATDNLSGVLFILGSVFALFSMSNCFLSNGVVFKDSMIQDFDIKSNLVAASIACLPSLIIVNFLDPSFIDILSFTGIYTASIQGILILSATIKAREKSRIRIIPFGNYPLYFLTVIFVFLMTFKTIEMLI